MKPRIARSRLTGSGFRRLRPMPFADGFANLKPGTEYNSSADAATGRSRADWLVGMNLSRAYSLALNEEISVGRVQTPTLAMVVERELAIQSFVPEEYMEVLVTFHPVGLPADEKYVGVWFRPGRNKAAAELESSIAGRWRRSESHHRTGQEREGPD